MEIIIAYSDSKDLKVFKHLVFLTFHRIPCFPTLLITNLICLFLQAFHCPINNRADPV